MNNIVINKLFLFISIISTSYSMEKINPNNIIVVNTKKPDCIKFTEKLNAFSDQAVDKFILQIANEAKQGNWKDGGFLDKYEVHVNNIIKIIKPLLRGEEFEFNSLNSPGEYNAFILYKYLVAFRNYVVDLFPINFNKEFTELKEYPRIINNKEWMNKKSDWYKEAIKELRKKANNIDEEKILINVEILNRCLALDFLIYWIMEKKVGRDSLWIKHNDDYIGKYNYKMGEICNINNENFKEYKIQNKEDVKHIQINRSKKLEEKCRNIISKFNYSKDPKINQLSEVYKLIDWKLIDKLNNINKVKNDVNKLLDAFDKININEVKGKIKMLLNNLDKNYAKNKNDLMRNINAVKCTIDELLNNFSTRSIAKDIQKLMSIIKDDIKDLFPDLYNSYKYNLSQDNTKQDNIKWAIERCCLCIDNTDDFKNKMKELLKNLNIDNIEDTKKNIKTLLDNLNINDFKNRIEQILNKLDIENIINYKYIKQLLNGLYKYNLSASALPNIDKTYLTAYLDQLLSHYDPIKKEYDK